MWLPASSINVVGGVGGVFCGPGKAIHVNKKSQSAKAKDFAVSAQMRREVTGRWEMMCSRLVFSLATTTKISDYLAW